MKKILLICLSLFVANAYADDEALRKYEQQQYQQQMLDAQKEMLEQQRIQAAQQQSQAMTQEWDNAYNSR